MEQSADGRETDLPLLAYAIDIACAREEVAPKLVEADSHDPVCCEESFLNSIPMVHINIHIQYPLMILEQLKNSQDDVIDIAEPRCLQMMALRQCEAQSSWSLVFAYVLALWAFPWQADAKKQHKSAARFCRAL